MPKMQPAQRASNEEQKQHRLRAIVEAALALSRESSFAELSIARIAERAGIAKGTIYLYFPSKDALAVELERSLVTAWLGDLNAALEQASWGMSPLQLAGAIGATIDRHEADFAVLVGLLSSAERTTETAGLAAVKIRLLDGLAAGGARLERVAPYLGAGQGVQLLFLVFALVVGLQQSVRATPVLDPSGWMRAELRPLQRGVSWFVAEAVRVHLEGLRGIRAGSGSVPGGQPPVHGLSPEAIAHTLADADPEPRRRSWWKLP